MMPELVFQECLEPISDAEIADYRLEIGKGALPRCCADCAEISTFTPRQFRNQVLHLLLVREGQVLTETVAKALADNIAAAFGDVAELGATAGTLWCINDIVWGKK